jgi:hypothetical protein
VLGLSFAGWNVIASLLLAVAALRGALAQGLSEPGYGSSSTSQ